MGVTSGITKLRVLFAEVGYQTYGMSRHHRQGAGFVAVPRKGPGQFLLVRVYGDKQPRIEIRPFCSGDEVGLAQRLLSCVQKKGIRLRWRKEPVPVGDRKRVLEEFLSPKGLADFKQDFEPRSVKPEAKKVKEFPTSTIAAYGERAHTYAVPSRLRY